MTKLSRLQIRSLISETIYSRSLTKDKKIISENRSLKYKKLKYSKDSEKSKEQLEQLRIFLRSLEKLYTFFSNDAKNKLQGFELLGATGDNSKRTKIPAKIRDRIKLTWGSNSNLNSISDMARHAFAYGNKSSNEDYLTQPYERFKKMLGDPEYGNLKTIDKVIGLVDLSLADTGSRDFVPKYHDTKAGHFRAITGTAIKPVYKIDMVSGETKTKILAALKIMKGADDKYSADVKAKKDAAAKEKQIEKETAGNYRANLKKNGSLFIYGTPESGDKYGYLLHKVYEGGNAFLLLIAKTAGEPGKGTYPFLQDKRKKNYKGYVLQKGSSRPEDAPLLELVKDYLDDVKINFLNEPIDTTSTDPAPKKKIILIPKKSKKVSEGLSRGSLYRRRYYGRY